MTGSFGNLKRASKVWLKHGLARAVRGSGQGIPPEHWGLERKAGGRLALGGFDLAELAEREGSPLHVVDAARLRANAHDFVDLPAGRRARCEVFFSYKTNPVPGVLAELHACGIGAEVISHYELWLALKLGVPPSKLVYNGPAKSEASIRLAIELGIQLLNINHREEIALIARIASALGRKPRVALRVTTSGWGGQFGIPVAGGEAVRAFAEARATGCLDVVGLHVHRGGMLRTRDELSSLLDGVLGFADVLDDELGLTLEVLDVGGSLASRSVRSLSSGELRLNLSLGRELEAPDPATGLTIRAYVAELLERVETHYERRGTTPPRVFVEPGRALTSDTQLLLARVLSIKQGEERTHAILDAGINLAESCRSEYHQVLSVDNHGSARRKAYTLVGPICSPGDTLRWAATLPELAPESTLAIMDSGAYFVPFATSFSFPQPAIVMIDNARLRVLRRAETFDDLICYDAPASDLASTSFEQQSR